LPKAQGYTDAIARAGVFTRREAQGHTSGSDRSRMVDAIAALDADIAARAAELAVVQARRDAIRLGRPCASCEGVGDCVIEDRLVACLACWGLGVEPPCSEHAPCCGRRDEFNGFSSGARVFTCPRGCACHD
jgi:hypothetical protein